MRSVRIFASTFSSTYESVMEAWTSALVTVDKLIAGNSQAIKDGSVLLGLSSWHICPDLVILGKTSTLVNQKDDLVNSGGLLTVGLESRNPGHDSGVYWSLPLAYFRTYGEPYYATRALASETSRITMDQLMLVALGSILGKWEVPLPEYDRVTELITLVWRAINLHGSGNGQSRSWCAVGEHNYQGVKWLERLAKSADELRHPGD